MAERITGVWLSAGRNVYEMRDVTVEEAKELASRGGWIELAAGGIVRAESVAAITPFDFEKPER